MRSRLPTMRSYKEFNWEEVEKLRSLLETLNKSLGSCSLAQVGMCLLTEPSKVSNSLQSNPWVIDSGATNHMTNNLVKVETYQSSSGNPKITMADGSPISISGHDSI